MENLQEYYHNLIENNSITSEEIFKNATSSGVCKTFINYSVTLCLQQHKEENYFLVRIFDSYAILHECQGSFSLHLSDDVLLNNLLTEINIYKEQIESLENPVGHL